MLLRLLRLLRLAWDYSDSRIRPINVIHGSGFPMLLYKFSMVRMMSVVMEAVLLIRWTG